VTAPVHIEYLTYSLPKRGNQEQENEDAAWPRGCGAFPANTFRCAVADGATQAAFSGEWAQKLVEAYGKKRLTTMSDEHLADLRKGWNDHYRSANLPWYLEEKVLRGGFAAFVGLEIKGPIGRTRFGSWEAVAIGDCCLFSVHRDSARVRFPFKSPRQFGDTPFLVSTNAGTNTPLREQRKHDAGHWHEGDAFYLMSDALAAWFLSEIVQAKRPWRDLDTALDSPGSFQALISDLRGDGRMKNDDATVARVRVR
jgi:hypothetical protein